MPTLTALSIARPLLEALAIHPFEGRVMGRFERAINLAEPTGWVIAVTGPEIGRGPFSVVVAAPPDFFNQFAVGQPVIADQHGLTVGKWRLDWSAAAVWEPRLISPTQPLRLTSKIVHALRPYIDWPAPTESTPVLGERLRQAAAQFSQALGDKTKAEQVARAASSLAGLGSGLTPAGDDYLVGAMAALWLTDLKALLPEIAAAAVPQTTTLSAAFLTAAARGEFLEPWHHLAQSLYTGTIESLSRALAQVATFGASSGRDALAGFTTSLYRLRTRMRGIKRMSQQ
ncbi:MAG: DUF2877 domain-containing protein [Anaerolineales bacterium]|nr:DUF2877 domain-containing protein [Anaerolineales bacterium]